MNMRIQIEQLAINVENNYKLFGSHFDRIYTSFQLMDLKSIKNMIMHCYNLDELTTRKTI